MDLILRSDRDASACCAGGREGRSMTTEPKDDAREERIAMEIVVDAYAPEEQAVGWSYHLEGTLQFPFLARCTAVRAIASLRTGDEVEVVGLAPEEECRHEMFVATPWERQTLAVLLSHREGITADAATQHAIESGTTGSNAAMNGANPGRYVASSRVVLVRLLYAQR